MAKQVIKWEAADGTQHDTRADAVRHDQHNALVEGLAAFYEGGEFNELQAAHWILDNYAPRPVEPEVKVYRNVMTGQTYKVKGQSTWIDADGVWMECAMEASEAPLLIERGDWVEFVL